MPFSHLPITSQNDGAEGGGLLAALQSRCSQSEKFSSPYHVISKEGITTRPSPNSKEAHTVFLFTRHFIYSLAHSQTFTECQVGAGHCRTLRLMGAPKWYPGCLLQIFPQSTHPVWFLIFWKTVIYSLARWKREHLAQAHSLVIKPLWFSNYLDKK